MNVQTKRGWIRIGSIIMLVGIFFLPMMYGKAPIKEYGDVSASFTMFEFATIGMPSAFLVIICAIGLLVSSWITNAALAKTIRLLLEISSVGGYLWTLFTVVSSGQVQDLMDQQAASDYNVSTSTIKLIDPSDVHFEWGFWIICLGFIIAVIGTFVPDETPGK